MKSIRFCRTILLLAIGISCKKNSSVSGIASVNIINAIPNIPSLDVYETLTDSAFYLYQAPLSYQSNTVCGMPAGSNALTLVSTGDTSKPFFQGTIQLVTGGIFSFYLAGQYPSIDTLFTQDVITNYSDSVAGVRFVNLSSGSAPMTVNLVGNPFTQAEFTGLAYKSISSFKTYPDTNGISAYNFEVHDAKTGNLLTTYSWNFSVFNNNTLVICGSEDSASATPISVFPVNNF